MDSPTSTRTTRCQFTVHDIPALAAEEQAQAQRDITGDDTLTKAVHATRIARQARTDLAPAQERRDALALSLHVTYLRMGRQRTGISLACGWRSPAESWYKLMTRTFGTGYARLPVDALLRRASRQGITTIPQTGIEQAKQDLAAAAEATIRLTARAEAAERTRNDLILHLVSPEGGMSASAVSAATGISESQISQMRSRHRNRA